MKPGFDSYPNLLSLIGDTPLIELNKVVENFKGDFFAKWEAYNPGHSNKDTLHFTLLTKPSDKG